MSDFFDIKNRIAAEIFSYDGRMSVYLNDLKGGVIGIDEKRRFETASCIKVFILAALYDMCARGERSLDEVIECGEKHLINGSGVMRALRLPAPISVFNAATLMIIVSDNTATNLMIDYLGLDNINAFIQRAGFADTVLHNEIDFEKYDRLGTTTAADYGEFFFRLAKKELLGGEADEAMLEILKKQHYNTMLVSNIPPYYFDSEDTGDEQLIWSASKSGSMNACRNDGGIIHTPAGDYVIVILTTEFSDSLYYNAHPSTVYGARVSRLVFERFVNNGGRF